MSTLVFVTYLEKLSQSLPLMVCLHVTFQCFIQSLCHRAEKLPNSTLCRLSPINSTLFKTCVEECSGKVLKAINTIGEINGGGKKKRPLAKVRLMARRAVCGNLRKRGAETKFKEQQQNWAVYYLPLTGDLKDQQQNCWSVCELEFN